MTKLWRFDLLISSAEFSSYAPYPPAKGGRGSKGRGIRFEKLAHPNLRKLAESRGAKYRESPWIKYINGGSSPRYCQPDALVEFPDGRFLILEIKLSHTVKAWEQLRQLYTPVLRAIYGRELNPLVCEVVRSYDCALAYPERVQVVDNFMDAKPEVFNVMIWNPLYAL